VPVFSKGKLIVREFCQSFSHTVLLAGFILHECVTMPHSVHAGSKNLGYHMLLSTYNNKDRFPVALVSKPPVYTGWRFTHFRVSSEHLCQLTESKLSLLSNEHTALITWLCRKMSCILMSAD